MVGSYNGSSLTLSEIQSPTQTILFFEILGSARSIGASYETDKLSKVDVRHDTGCNFAFVDGHARWMRPPETVIGRTNMWNP
jgi:prepilin-type processing-associated H-X9-DG protein